MSNCSTCFQNSNTRSVSCCIQHINSRLRLPDSRHTCSRFVQTGQYILQKGHSCPPDRPTSVCLPQQVARILRHPGISPGRCQGMQKMVLARLQAEILDSITEANLVHGTVSRHSLGRPMVNPWPADLSDTQTESSRMPGSSASACLGSPLDCPVGSARHSWMLLLCPHHLLSPALCPGSPYVSSRPRQVTSATHGRSPSISNGKI